jgi:hypothetical protein
LQTTASKDAGRCDPRARFFFVKRALTSPETGLTGEDAASSGGFSSAVAAGDGVQQACIHRTFLARGLDAGER